MQNQLMSFIESLKVNKEIIFFDEAATKQAIILKLLTLLGWDTFNIDEVTPEYSVSNKRVDYSLRINSINKVFIEVKKIGEELENHQEQLLSYSFQEGVKLSILTNGVTWWFYLPLYEGNWEQRKFYTIDIRQQESEDIVSKFINLISKANIASGKSNQNAEEIYKGKKKQIILKDTLPIAWNKIISEIDELLVELINETTEKICGYKADSELVEQFLLKYKEQILISPIQTSKQIIPAHHKATSSTQTLVTDSYSGKSISNFSFRSVQYKVKHWKQLLIKLCDILHVIHKDDFKKVLIIVGRKRPYFTYDANELRVPYIINNTGIFVETNLSANNIVKICFDMLAVFGYPNSDLKIEAH